MKKVKSKNSKVKRNTIVIAGCAVMLALICGCETMKEGFRGFLGVSTKVLEEERGNAVTKEFKFDYADTYAKTKKALHAMHSYVYREVASEKLIAVYISSADTTPVGIFLTPVDAGTTRVEVVSPSTFGKEYIAKKLFLRLEGNKELISDKDEEKNEKTASKKGSLIGAPLTR